MSTDSFPLFSQLPREIRVMIWKASLPGPRLISIRQRRLKTTMLEWAYLGFPHVLNQKRSKVVENTGETLLSASSAFWSYPGRMQLWPDKAWDDPASVENVNPGLMGITTDTLPPAQLLACSESNEVAGRFYRPAFTIAPALPQTYFDFDLDILYFRKNYTSPPDSLRYSLNLLDNTEELWKVKNLAIEVGGTLGPAIESESNPGIFNPIGHRMGAIVATYLKNFGGVEKLTLVIVDHEQTTTDTSGLCLIDLVTVADPDNYNAPITGGERQVALNCCYPRVTREKVEMFRRKHEKGSRKDPYTWSFPDVIEYKTLVSPEVKRRIQESSTLLNCFDVCVN